MSMITVFKLSLSSLPPNSSLTATVEGFHGSQSQVESKVLWTSETVVVVWGFVWGGLGEKVKTGKMKERVRANEREREREISLLKIFPSRAYEILNVFIISSICSYFVQAHTAIFFQPSYWQGSVGLKSNLPFII